MRTSRASNVRYWASAVAAGLVAASASVFGLPAVAADDGDSTSITPVDDSWVVSSGDGWQVSSEPLAVGSS